MKNIDGSGPFDVEARHKDVLGHPPRIAPSERNDVAAEVLATTDRLLGGILGLSTSRPELPVETIPEIMFTLCRFPDLWHSMIDLAVQLQGPNSILEPRDRKLAILRTGWLCQAPYEFGEHVNQAKRLGLTDNEIERIKTGSAAPEWSDHERAILRAVEELHTTTMVSDPTWAQLARDMSEHQLFELLVLIGQFTATAYFQNALRLRLERGNAGLVTG